MSIQYERSGQKHGLSEDNAKSNSAIPVKVISTSSSSNKTSMRDKTADEPSKIGFLNQCKLELSAEVIRWKEENHKLRKEKEACEHQVCEFQIVLDKLSRRNAELEAGLLSLNQDYEKLKMHSLAINEENKFLHKKLPKTCSKYYSYPWSEFSVSHIPFMNGAVNQRPKAVVDPTRGWEEVSEKLIKQMKLEMKELQELGQKLAIHELASNAGGETSSTVKDHIHSEQNVNENVDKSIINLTCELKSLQHRLAGQHQKLCVLLRQPAFCCKNLCLPADEVTHHTHNDVPDGRKVDSVCGLIDWETSDVSNRKFVRPSDDSFRAYFTRQLSNSKSTEELKHMMNFYLHGNKGFLDQNTMQNNITDVQGLTAFRLHTESGVSNARIQPPLQRDSHVCSDKAVGKPTANKAHIDPENCLFEEERVCPICEAVFPKVFSQKEFESHVVAHLEAESASLLDQYEIL